MSHIDDPVKPDESGKTNGWWASQVELVQEADRG